MPHSGSCLCGQTKVSVKSTHEDQIICHCDDCKLTSGSAFSTNILPKQADVEITGAVKQYDSKAASGNTVSRLFCGNCGYAVAHKSVVFGDAMAVQTGALSGFAKLPVSTELFTKSRWTGIAPTAGAAQAWTMPGTEPPKV
ncbi:Mss4-like protein [Leucosporidium creatinivorum]|uniref:Mss4-like protein n=1 Tax=Leucosporidium creatinivorum TaxID=106004 RepID=A0A1Y2ENF2_9BASI|nr:Mss4-like protein [Leucosporidium creatinivorum]